MRHDQDFNESLERVFEMVDLLRVFRGPVQHDEEAEREADDQDQVVAQALHQVKGDGVEHQTDAAAQHRVSENRSLSLSGEGHDLVNILFVDSISWPAF